MDKTLSGIEVSSFKLSFFERLEIYKKKKAEANKLVEDAKKEYKNTLEKIAAQKKSFLEKGFSGSRAEAYVKPGIYSAKIALQQKKEEAKNIKRDALRLLPPFHWFYKVVDFEGHLLLKPRGHVLLSSLVVILIAVLCQFMLELDTAQFIPENLGVVLSQLFGPINIGTIKTWGDWWSYMGSVAIPAIWETVLMMFIATAVGAILTIPFMILCASNIVKSKAVVYTFRTLLNFLRTIPTVVLALIGVTFFGYSQLAGIFAMIFFTMGIMIKIMYEYIETVDMHPYEACISAGATKPKAFALAIAPQITPAFLSNTLYTFEINVRASVILGMVNAGGVGKLIQDSVATGMYNQIGAILVPLFVVVFVLQMISSEVRKRTL